MIFQTNIPVIPVPKARARTILRNGKVHSFTPAKTAYAEEAIKWHLRREFKGEMIKEPCEVHIVFSMPFPASWSDKKKLSLLWMPCTTKPDVDNLSKLVLDACNGIIWKDDGIVWKLIASKIYSRDPKIDLSVFYEK